jgi:tetratricopeptide (TPR) repeat protein
MAQVEEFLGGSEAEDPQDRQAIAGADPLATSLAMDAARASPELSDKAGAYLDSQARLVERQARLVDIQAQDLIDQRALQTSHLRLRRFTERLKAATQVLIVVLGIVVGLGLLVMLSDAFSSRSVVVDAFDAPPALAARGLSGTVVASAVLDQLQKLQAATRSASKGLKTTSAWASDIKVEAPGTGVSIGEIDRLLHARFGHDVHISGDLIQTETGALALTVRGAGVPAQTFQGQELDRLTAQAAEYVYGASQPYQFAVYLVTNNRENDAIAFLPAAYARATDDDQRGELSNVLGNAYANSNQPARAIASYRLAMALEPPNWKAWHNLVIAEVRADGEEAGWREGQAMLAAAAKAPRKSRPTLRFLAAAALISRDMPLRLASLLNLASFNNGAGAGTSLTGPAIADTYALMHDPASAARSMASSDPENWRTKAEAPLLAGYAALDRGDAPAAVAPLQEFSKAWQANAILQSTYFDVPCFLGLAYGLTGRLAEAEAVFKRTGPWARCYAMHGDVLEHAGDLAGAERVWAQGIAVAPDLPPVYLHRGMSELNRGDLARAGADLAAASARSPHWADPLKAWGDLLAREGRWKAALAKYDAALKYAPAWAALHQARAAAAQRG